jgi:hypothetical protein
MVRAKISGIKKATQGRFSEEGIVLQQRQILVLV